MSSKDFEIVSKFQANLDKLKPLRDNNNSVYQDINDYVLLNGSNFTTTTSPGARKDEVLFDDTAVHSAVQLASILHSGLTDPSTRWFNLKSTHQAINDLELFKLWISQVHRAMFAEFSRSKGGFTQQNHEFLMNLITYGTAIMWCTDEPGTGLVFQTINLAEIFIEENSRGFVDTVYRCFELTARQAAQEFGEDNLGQKLKGALSKDPHKKFKFLHVVLPAKDFERSVGPIPKSQSGKEHLSVHMSLEDKNILKVGGFHEMAYVVARWEKLAGEVYGRSPAWNTLSQILMANAMQETIIRAAQKTMDPAILMSDDGVMLPLQTFPGGVIIGGLSDDGRELVKPFNPRPDPNIGLQTVDHVQESIRKAFFVDQFMDRKGVQPLTATEVQANQENRLRLIGPQVRRVEDEYLSPIIDRVYGLLERAGRLPPMPEELKAQIAEITGGGSHDLDIEYISPLAFTQRTSQLLSYNRLFANVGTFIQTNPEAMDNFNVDKIVREAAEMAGIPIDQLKPQGQVEKDRAGREEAAMQQQQLQELQAGAETAATLQKSGINILPE